MPWLSSGTMHHPNLLSPRFLHIPNNLPSDFSLSPKLTPTPKNNQTLAAPFPTWHFRICFVFFPHELRRFFGPALSWSLLHLLARCRESLEFSCSCTLPAFPTLRPERMFTSEVNVNLCCFTRLLIQERR
jgi:hypothetical protein